MDNVKSKDNINLYVGVLLFLCLFSFVDLDKTGKFLTERKIFQTYKNSEKMLGFGVSQYDRHVYIIDVLDLTPAKKAGVEEGDKILEVEGQKIYDVNQFKKVIDSFHKNQSLNMLVYKKSTGTDVNIRITPLVLIPQN